MDVFDLHQKVIDDYRAFTSGFVDIRDERIRSFVEQQFADGVQSQWMHPVTRRPW